MRGLAGQFGKIEQIALLGAGLLGGSIGLGLRAAGFGGRIVGYGRTPATLEAAVAAGCIDAGCTDLGPCVRQSQLAILCAPVGAFAGLLERLAPHDHADLVVTDVGSTKVPVCQDARRLLPRPQWFIGSHPMAGGEQHGPTNARADLFQGRPCVICAEPDSDPHALAVVEDLWRTLGMRLIHLDAREADEQVARISHLPHAVAVLLVELAGRLGGLEVASTGFRDTTRVASGDPQIWLDIFASNRAATMRAIDAFMQDLTRFRAVLEHADQDALSELLSHAKAIRDDWLKQGDKAR